MDSNKLGILPYCEYEDGAATMSPDFIFNLYHSIESAYPGLVFYDGKINSAAEFFEHVTRRDVFFFVITYDWAPVAMIWFNRLDTTHCYGHWCWFADSLNYTEKVAASKWVLNKVFEILPYSVLVGHIPTLNARAVKFAKDTGMTEIGVIPDLLWSEALQAPIDGTVLYLRRKDLIDESLHDDSDGHRDGRGHRPDQL